jgi:hypothetical protein
MPPNGQVGLREALGRLVQLDNATNRPDAATRWRAEVAEVGRTDTRAEDGVYLTAILAVPACSGRNPG